jgi:predicted AlkP superfamily pyrophosphatase or phosphodiesterase
MATWKVGEWISAAVRAVLKDPELAPDLCLTYLPSLDYDLQRKDPGDNPISNSLRERVHSQISAMAGTAMEQGYEVIVFGDYHIAPANEPVLPNLALRRAGLMKTRSINRMAYPDFYDSRAFAVADHEIAHVYVPEPGDVSWVRETLLGLAGVDQVLEQESLAAAGLNHPNSGELVIMAKPGKWFAYPWWIRDKEAPDYAGHVDIHNKPGYDPCELFFGWPPGSVSRNGKRVRGSHGRTGPGREVTWAASFALPEKPKNLIQLASAVRDRLDRGM